MVTLHPRPLTEDGQRFVVLPFEEFEALEEEREQILDMIAFAEAEAEVKESQEPRVSWEVVKQELGLKF